MEEGDNEENEVEAVGDGDTKVGFLEEELSTSELVSRGMNESMRMVWPDAAVVVMPATDVDDRSNSKRSQSA